MRTVQANKSQRAGALPSHSRENAALEELLTELAFALLPRGMTPGRFAELARYAFARAAAEVAVLRNGRINNSRVAAQTGLTRAEVKRLLHYGPLVNGHLHEAPVERVIRGWQRDPPFALRPGHPKRLRVAGSRASFAQLVTKYGGDLPYRAVLSELRRMGAVCGDDHNLQLKTSYKVRRRADLAFLSPVLPVLIDRIRTASTMAGHNVSVVLARAPRSLSPPKNFGRLEGDR